MPLKFKYLSVLKSFFRYLFAAISLAGIICQAEQKGPDAGTLPVQPLPPIKSAVAFPPVPYTNGLPNVVLLSLVMNLGPTNLATGTVIANNIALGYCNTAIDEDALYAGLTNGFANTGYNLTDSTNVATAIVNTYSPDTTELSNLLFFSLTLNFPLQPSNVTKLQAYAIAGSCEANTAPESLYTNLISEFSRFGLMNGTIPSSNVAASVCEVVFNAGITNETPTAVKIANLAVPALQLTNILTDILTNAVKGVPLTTLIEEANAIAAASADTTDFQSLYCSLTNQLCLNTNLNISFERSKVLANEIAGYLYNGVLLPSRLTNGLSAREQREQRLQEIAAANETNRWRFEFSAGAEFLNPYGISVVPGAPTGTLTNSGSSTVPYFQLELMRRWIMAPTYRDDGSNNFWDGFSIVNIIKRFKNGAQYSGDPDWTPDFDFQMGFIVQNNNSTNPVYSASTLAGSDIYFQAATGIPIYRNWQSYDYPFQLSLGLSAGVTTDEQFEKVHPKLFVGGLIDFGLPFLSTSTNSLNPGLIEIKMGMGYLDNPDLTGTNEMVYLNSNGFPKFEERWAPQAGARAFIPVLNDSVYLDIEANAYFSQPNQWDVKIGATIPFSTIQKNLPFLSSGSL